MALNLTVISTLKMQHTTHRLTSLKTAKLRNYKILLQFLGQLYCDKTQCLNLASFIQDSLLFASNARARAFQCGGLCTTLL